MTQISRKTVSSGPCLLAGFDRVSSCVLHCVPLCAPLCSTPSSPCPHPSTNPFPSCSIPEEPEAKKHKGGAIKRRKSYENGLKAMHERRKLTSTDGDASSQARSSRKACCHVLCSFSMSPASEASEERTLTRVPPDPTLRTAILEAVGYTKEIIKDHVSRKTDLRLCSVHFNGDRVVSFHDDPVVQGVLPGRNTNGDKWFRDHVRAHADPLRPNPLQRARPTDPQQEQIERLTADLSRLTAKVQYLEKSKAGLTRALNSANAKAQASSHPAEHCLPVGVSVPHSFVVDDRRCVFYTSLTSEKLELVLRMMEAIGVSTAYEDLKRTSTNFIPFRDAFVLMLVRLRCYLPLVILAGMCGKEESHLGRTVHDLIVLTSVFVSEFLSAPVTPELEDRYKVDGFEHPDFKNVRHILDGKRSG